MWLQLIFGGIFAASGLTAFLSAIGGAGLPQSRPHRSGNREIEPSPAEVVAA